MNCSTPGFPVHHQLLEYSQTHVHQVGDAIQPSCPLSSPSPPAFNLSQQQSLFQSQFFTPRGQSIGVSASVLPMNIQDWFPLEWTGWISLLSKGLSRVFSNTTVQKCQFFGAQLSLSEKAMALHSSTLAWKIPWTEEAGRLQSMGSQRVRHDWATSLSLFTFMHWRKKWQPTAVFLPGASQGQGSLVGCHLWGRTESDTTEVT